jgi:hypothetical protein
MIPASSSSPATCIIDEIPERAEKGRFFATQTRMSRRNVPYSGGKGPMECEKSAR